jgi:hypothetical protein
VMAYPCSRLFEARVFSTRSDSVPCSMSFFGSGEPIA